MGTNPHDSTDHEPMTQVSESLGLFFSGSYLVLPVAVSFYQRYRTKRLGLKKRQTIWMIEIHDLPKRNPYILVDKVEL